MKGELWRQKCNGSFLFHAKRKLKSQKSVEEGQTITDQPHETKLSQMLEQMSYFYQRIIVESDYWFSYFHCTMAHQAHIFSGIWAALHSFFLRNSTKIHSIIGGFTISTLQVKHRGPVSKRWALYLPNFWFLRQNKFWKKRLKINQSEDFCYLKIWHFGFQKPRHLEC